MEYVLTANALCRQYKHFKALNNFSIHVPKGAIYGFVGKNGAGKTTFIRLVCGLQYATSGDFTLYGISSGSKGIETARRRVGAIVESPSIYMDMTAEENLRAQYRVLGLPSREGIQELLSLVGLENTGRKKGKEFFSRHASAAWHCNRSCGEPGFSDSGRTGERTGPTGNYKDAGTDIETEQGTSDNGVDFQSYSG